MNFSLISHSHLPSWPRSWFVSNSFKFEYSAGFSLKNFKSSENWGRKSGEYSQQHSIMFRTSKFASVGKGSLFPRMQMKSK